MLQTVKRSLLRILPASIAGRLRSWNVHRLIRNYPARVVRHTYGGESLEVYLPDPLAESWYDHDWTELPEILALRKTRLSPGRKVFDIGAHQGVVAMMLARQVGPSGLVVAVEASRHNAAAAEKNRELNRMSQITVVHAAVSDRSGTLDFNEGLNGQLDDGSGARGRVTVDAVTVDGLVERFGIPDVVFLDVEGAEGMALAGARRVLAGGTDFFIEVHAGCGLEKLGGSVDAIRSRFRPELFTLMARAEDDEVFRPLPEGSPAPQGRFFLLALSGR